MASDSLSYTSIGLLIAAAIGSPAHAQVANAPQETTQEQDGVARSGEGLTDIVVTAERRATRVQDLPIAITALSGEALVQQRITDVFSLQKAVPGLQTSEGTGQGTRITVRGIGTELGCCSESPAVAIIQDGFVYASTITGGVDFFDAERVEVLRGPQGTISGSSATAGAIQIYSARPTDTLQGQLKASVENFGRVTLEGFVSGPVAGDAVSVRLAARMDRSDGWLRNTLLNEKLGALDRYQVRGGVLLRPAPNLEAHLIVEGIRDRSTNVFLVQAGRARPDVPSVPEYFGVRGFDRKNRTVEHDQPNRYDVKKLRSVLNLGWDVGDGFRVTSTTGYLDYKSTVVRDVDGTRLPVAVYDYERFDVEEASQEVTLTADLTDRFDLLAGALYFHQQTKTASRLGLLLLNRPVGASQSRQSEDYDSLGIYAQGRLKFSDQLRLTAGIRYTRDEKDYAFINEPFGVAAPPLRSDPTWKAWTPRVSIEFNPGKDVLLYGTVSRGFKSGGTNSAGTFNPEYVWNYEAGVKASALDGRLRGSLSGFHMKYTDLQQSLLTYDTVNQRLVTRVVNANSATINGAELEVEALLSPRFRLTANASWLDATFDELRDRDVLYPELGQPLPGTPAGSPNFRDLSGNDLPRAPKWKTYVSGEYSAPVTLSGSDAAVVARASYAWQSRTYFNFYNHPLLSEHAYGLIDASISLRRKGVWELSVYGRNLADTAYFTHHGFHVGLTPPVPSHWAFPGTPRTYGISFSHNF